MDVFLLLLGSATALLFIFYNIKGKSHHPPLPPGPKGWPILGNLPQLGTKPHHILATLARTYGPLFRLRFGRVNVVVAADSATASLFLKTHDTNFSNRPPHSGAEIVCYNYQDLVFAPYGPRWRMLRKLCNTHLFSMKALEDFQHVRSEEASLLVQRLSVAAFAVSLGEEVNMCVTNALGRVVVGRRVFAEGKEAEEFKEMVEELMRVSGVFNIGDFIPELKWLDLQGVAAQFKKLSERFDRFLDRLIEETATSAAATSVKEGSLLSVLVGLTGKEDVDGEGGTITDTKIKALFVNLFSAGTDTTSSTVEWALAELIRHPDILLKVQRELDNVVGRERLVSESDLPNLPYLHAVVKETFRLHPSTPLSLPRVAAEDCEVAGYHIAKNTTLLVNVWAIGRDPKAWNDPLEFRPSRFLPGGERPDADVRGNDFEVIPFGAGRRICAGMSLGVRMVQFLVATLAHSFEWKLEGGVESEKLDMEEAYGITLQRAQPLRVYPAKRLLPSAYA